MPRLSGQEKERLAELVADGVPFWAHPPTGRADHSYPVGSLGLVGHTHEPALFAYDGAATRGAPRSGRVLRLARDRRLHGQPGGGLRQPARRGELVAHRRH